MDELYYTMHNSTTIKMNKLKYTKREVKFADEAMKLQRILSFPADETIPHLQTIINIPTTRKELARSVDIYGKDRGSIRGKATKQKDKNNIPRVDLQAIRSVTTSEHRHILYRWRRLPDLGTHPT